MPMRGSRLGLGVIPLWSIRLESRQRAMIITIKKISVFALFCVSIKRAEMRPDHFIIDLRRSGP